MPRFTDTRAQVRIFAQKIHDEGGTPTPKLIRQLLGKGSPNTIVDELRAWSASVTRAPLPENSSVMAFERAGLKEVAFYLEKAAAQSTEQKAFLEQAKGLLQASHKLPVALSGMAEKFQELAQKLEDDRSWMEQELRKMNERFEAVQRRALLQIDEARTEAIRWKTKYSALEDEHGAWRSTTEQRAHQLTEQVSWLRGRLNIELSSSPTRQAQPLNSGKKLQEFSYPGHPRARVLPADDD